MSLLEIFSLLRSGEIVIAVIILELFEVFSHSAKRKWRSQLCKDLLGRVHFSHLITLILSVDEQFRPDEAVELLLREKRSPVDNDPAASISILRLFRLTVSHRISENADVGADLEADLTVGME